MTAEGMRLKRTKRGNDGLNEESNPFKAEKDIAARSTAPTLADIHALTSRSDIETFNTEY